VASDGGLWVICERTSRRPSRLLRVNRAGKVTGPFRLPNEPNDPNISGAGIDPRDLRAGSAGQMWFTSGAGLVCNVTPRGSISCARTPTSTLEPRIGTFAMVLGPDGNVWMLQRVPNDQAGTDRSWIVRVTPDLQMTEFPIPEAMKDVTAAGAGFGTAGAGFGLVWSTSGHLWFGYRRGEGAGTGRVSTAGDITDIPLVQESGPFALPTATTPDGSVYFQTADNFRRVLRLTADGRQNLLFRVPKSIDAVPIPLFSVGGDVWMLAQSLKAGLGPGHYRPGAIYRFRPDGSRSNFPLSGRSALRFFQPGLNRLFWATTSGYNQRETRLVSIGADGRLTTKLRTRAQVRLMSSTRTVIWLATYRHLYRITSR
jgi:streptogramin lyase